MSTPYFRLFTADWRDGTRLLSFEQRGFYIQLLTIHWDMQDRLPNDPQWLGRALGCNPRTVRMMVRQLSEAGKLVVTKDYIWNDRMLRDIERFKLSNRTYNGVGSSVPEPKNSGSNSTLNSTLNSGSKVSNRSTISTPNPLREVRSGLTKEVSYRNSVVVADDEVPQ